MNDIEEIIGHEHENNESIVDLNRFVYQSAAVDGVNAATEP